MTRTIRGLEDHETQERKRLHRDVRSPSQRLADALRLGQVQTGGIFAAGLCLLLFPACATARTPTVPAGRAVNRKISPTSRISPLTVAIFWCGLPFLRIGQTGKFFLACRSNALKEKTGCRFVHAKGIPLSMIL